MEQIEGNLAGSVVHIDNENYIYKLNKKREAKTYFACIVKLCKGSVVEEGTTITSIHAHNHTSDLVQIDSLKFKQELRLRSKNTNDSFKDIFISCEIKYPNGAKATGGLRNLVSLMKRARKGSVPPIPKSLSELDNIVGDSA